MGLPEALDQLDLIAQIAVALLGFIAIFLALPGPDGRFTQSDRHFVQALVMSSSIAIVLAIAPRALGLLLSEDEIWMTASWIALALGLPAFALEARHQLKMSREESEQIHWVWHVIAWGLAIASGALFVLAILRDGQTVTYYVGGVTAIVPLSLWVFTGVVFRRFF
jgi:hypothetical protein